LSNVSLAAVTKTFGDVPAVDTIDLEVGSGEFFSLLGPSGCGKTTTLRMIGGFEQPDSGRISLGGIDVTDLPPYKRDVNTVFQSYALFPHMTVAENVSFGLEQKKVARDASRTRVSEALQLVDLQGYDDRKPSQLSGGQQQRVALARAVINRPQLLLLDEPLGALDLKLRKHMQIELKQIQQEVGITFIYVTHDQEEAMTMSDRLAVMKDGKIDQIGTPQEVYERPATAFVASFLGASNLLEATLDSTEGDTARLSLVDGTSVTMPADRLPKRTDRLRIGVRPEKVRIDSSPATAPGTANVLRGRLRVATFMGVSRQYEVEGPGDADITVVAQNVGDGVAARPGDEITLSWDPKHTFAVVA
jgi:spermidine/putrescine transport system ATP-binding protein